MSATSLGGLGYFASKADPDLWLRPRRKPNGDEYYSMTLVYVDDILHFDHSREVLMERLEGLYRLKEIAKAPNRYIGANINKVQLKDGSLAWSVST